MKEYENLSFRSVKGPKRANSCIYRYERDKNVKTEWEGLWAVGYGSHSRDRETFKIQTLFSQFNVPGVFFHLSFVVQGFVETTAYLVTVFTEARLFKHRPRQPFILSL